LLIYNTATAGTSPDDVVPGFYFNFGTSNFPNWMRLTPSNENVDWKLTGNSGTNPVNDFIGTTDSKPLIFRTNGLERMRITENGNLGVGTIAPQSSAIFEANSTSQGFLPPRMTTAQRDAITNPAVGLLIFNISTNCLNMYYGTSWHEICQTYRGIIATGGTVTEYVANGTNGTAGVRYRVHTFTSSGTFHVTNSGSNGQVDYLIVAGGGGGGGYYVAGGGGGGGLLTGTSTLSVGAYAISVGAGGEGGTSGATGSNGGNSSFNALTALGGGGGGAFDKNPQGLDGGCGGGSSYMVTNGGIGTQGFSGAGPGGVSGSGPNPARGGGGGGMGSSGNNANPPLGGNGLSSSMSGVSVIYAAGGGGGSDGCGGSGGNSGNGGAGNGGSGIACSGPSSGTDASANRGGGGGGAGGNGTSIKGGSGGSGIVIIRYPITN
jgi:hypothetical protein